MKRSDLNQTVTAILKDLNLSTRCCDISSTYVDYVAMTFFVPRQTEQDVKIIRNKFDQLSATFGWKAASITPCPTRKEITVIFQKGDILTNTDARLPA